MKKNNFTPQRYIVCWLCGILATESQPESGGR